MLARVGAILVSATLGMIVYTAPVTSARADAISCVDAQVALSAAIIAEQTANSKLVSAQAALASAPWWNQDSVARQLGVASSNELAAQGVLAQARASVSAACGTPVIITPPPAPIVVTPPPSGLGLELGVHL